MNSRYDIVIIGRGAAAFSAAIKASEMTSGKALIAMVGKGDLGGTCVNVGCVPSKYLLEASNAYFYPKLQRFKGISSAKSTLDFSAVMRGLRDFVTRMRREKYEKVIRSYPNVEVFKGTAVFRSGKEVEIESADGQQKRLLRAKNIIIATGSRPSAPNIDGLKEAGFLTSDSIWNVDRLPESLAVIGGGAIGLEIGQAFLHFGSNVSVIEALPRIVAASEPEISQLLKNRLEEEGMSFFLKSRVARVKRENEKKVLELVTSKGRQQIEADEILVATGRAPNTDLLMLERAGVKTDGRGFIVVNENLQTSNKSIYAAGDCISKRMMLETLAAREGVVAVENILGNRTRLDYSHVPWAVFTNPQLASVGYNEEEFMRLTGSCSCRVVTLDKVAKAQMLGEDGLAKLIIDPDSGRVVGLHILSPSASEFIIEGAMAVKYGLTYEDIVNMTHVFPTLAEAIKLSAQAFIRSVDMMSCCVE
ncbi:MAG: mercury(II) reductase [Conexivisphaerales archaeon]